MVANPQQWAPVLTAVHGAEAMSAAAALLLNAGDGCDSRINGERINDAFNQKLAALDLERSAEILEARRRWGVR
jgi:hypothetical protein